jgi:O-methyltransferase
MVGRERLNNLEFCIRDAVNQGIPGDVVECGVWRGGAAILAKYVLDSLAADRNVWLCDSFEGLPAPTMQQDHGYDFTPTNDYLGVSKETVEAHFRRFSLLDDRVRFVKGFFKDSLPGVAINQIAVLRLDGDLYESTIQCLDNLYHKVVAGGYVIIDDYGILPPCKQAVHDFLNKHKLAPKIEDIDGTGVYWKVDTPLNKQ